jgi:hypothetical protein
VRTALAAAVALLALAAAGCGGGGGGGTAQTTRATTTARAGGIRPCILSARQRAAVAAARREIARMHRLEAPLTKWKPTGPSKLELAVERFLLDVGELPVDVKAQLMNKAKSAVGLCGDCFNAIEAEEPVPTTRLGGSRCS